jgi:dTDP-4-dehydrorhamnose 3,5-epimerase
MKIFDTEIPDIKMIQLTKYEDSRGFFVEKFRADRFQKEVADVAFVQDNFSRSFPGVIRGLHFQTNPWQGKLVGVTSGRIWDVAVDLRPDSPTFKRWISSELSGENQKMLWIPAGFAHGFCVLGSKPADVFYKVSQYFNAVSERGVRYDDPDLAIQWPKFGSLVISDKDLQLPSLRELQPQLSTFR